MSLSILVDAVLKGTLLLAAAFLVCLTLRRTSAAARHLLWSLTLLAIVAVPVLSNVLPWHVGVLPTPTVIARPENAGPHEAAQMAQLAAADDAVMRAPGGQVGETAGDLVASNAPLKPSESRMELPSWRSFVPLVVVLWLIGLGLTLSRLLYGVVTVRRVARKGEPLTKPQWVNAVTRAALRLRLRRAVRVVASAGAPMPFITGLLRPVIVLPSAAHTWDRERRQAVLLHELAHLRRADFLAHITAQVACVIYWFHPLVWAASRRMRAEGERACDDLVLEAGTRPSEYAGHLLDIVHNAGRSWAPVMALPMAQRSEFEGRLLAILEPGVKRHGVTPLVVVAIVAALALTAIPLVAMGPARGEQPPLDTPATEQGTGEVPAATATLPVVLPVESESIPVEPSLSETSPPASRGAQSNAAVSRIAAAEAAGPIVEGAEAAAADGAESDIAETHIVVAPETVAGPESSRPDLEPVTSTAPYQPAAAYAAALISALNDPTPAVRGAAVETLGKLQDTTAVLALMRTLRADSSPEVRRAAAWALGQYEDARAVPALSEALTRDADESVRAAAAHALGQIGDAGAVDALGDALSDANLEVRRYVIHALGQIEDARAVPALSRAVSDNVTELRRSAIHALGQIQDPSAIAAIQPALEDRDAEVRKTAAWALGQLEDARAVEPLAAALTSDDDVEVRRQAAWALGQIESKAAIAPLGEAIRDADAEVRRMAIWALGEIGDPAAVEALLPALDAADAETRRRAVWALGEIQDRRAVEPLAELVNDPDAEVRRQTVWALGEIQDQSAQTGLAAALADQNADVRRMAAWALGELGLRQAPPALLEAVSDANPSVRRAAAHALGEIEDPAAVPVLARVFDETDRDTRRTIVWALSEIRAPEAYDLLIRALQDEDPQIRRLAAQALGKRD
jgi:HEAT repeat protein/beta-lactamase regulating signal transducer with metallopeptidase domain